MVSQPEESEVVDGAFLGDLRVYVDGLGDATLLQGISRTTKDRDEVIAVAGGDGVRPGEVKLVDLAIVSLFGHRREPDTSGRKVYQCVRPDRRRGRRPFGIRGLSGWHSVSI